MMSSSCSGSVRVHNGMGCCNHAPGCCPFLGSDHCLCVAATTLQQQVRAQVLRCLPLLRDWHPVLLRAHNDLVGDTPSNEQHRVRIIDFLYHRMVSILSWHIPHQHRSRHPPLGGLLNVWPCALPAMVLGGISADPVPRSPVSVSGLPGWLSIELCAGANTFWANWRLASLPVLVLVSLL